MGSNGCASQYESKGPFADLAHFWQDLGVSAERHYFGSRHGKGASDGESAVVKSAATRAIKASQAVISTPDEMFAFCKGGLKSMQTVPASTFCTTLFTSQQTPSKETESGKPCPSRVARSYTG